MSQLPAGAAPFHWASLPDSLAHPAFSLLTDLEDSRSLSFLMSWGGGKEGTGYFSLYGKLLGTSTSTALGLNSGLGIWREPPSLGTKNLKVL